MQKLLQLSNNYKIIEEYNNGFSIEFLADKYCLFILFVKSFIRSNGKGLQKCSPLFYTKYYWTVLYMG